MSYVKLVTLEKNLMGSFHLFFVTFFFVLSGGVLILLVLRDEIVHVAFGFCEFHLVHALTGIPVQEGLASEHEGELLRNAFKHFLNSSGVADEGGGHLETLGGMSQTADLMLLGIHSTK